VAGWGRDEGIMNVGTMPSYAPGRTAAWAGVGARVGAGAPGESTRSTTCGVAGDDGARDGEASGRGTGEQSSSEGTMPVTSEAALVLGRAWTAACFCSEDWV
jgi:hypothetical protein